MAITHYLTVVTNENGKGINKTYVRGKDEEVLVDPAPNLYRGTAVTVEVKTVQDLIQILNDVALRTDQLLMMGHYHGMLPGEEFELLSAPAMKKEPGEVKLDRFELNGRPAFLWKKENSDISTIMAFDLDAKSGMLLEQRLDVLREYIPGFDKVLLIGAGSGRVMVDGKPYKDPPGYHVFFFAKNPEHYRTFSKALKILLTNAGHPDVFDPSSFTHNKLLYVGMPTVSGDGLDVRPTEFQLYQEGSKLDLACLGIPDENQLGKYTNLTGSRVGREAGDLVEVDDKHLKLDTKIEIQDGAPITVDEYWRSDKEKLRRQATFRESISWNGILSRHTSSGTPFLYDNGAGTRYVLSEVELNKSADIIKHRLKDLNTAEMLTRWIEEVVDLPHFVQGEIRSWVADKTNADRRKLAGDLKKAIKKKTLQHSFANIESEGKEVVEWDPANLDKVSKKVTKIIEDIDQSVDPILAHTDGPVTIMRSSPKTIRQVQEKHLAGEKYPEMPIIKKFNADHLRGWLTKYISFYKKNEEKIMSIAPPDHLIRYLLETAYEHLPPLAEIITHPTLNESAELITRKGYDPGTGIYSMIPPDLVPRNLEKVNIKKVAAWIRNEYYQDFPFASQLDLAGAACIPPMLIFRPIIASQCPGIAVSSPSPGTGKTTLLNMNSISCYGRPVACGDWTTNDDEMKKYLLGLLQEGQPFVAFDNIREGSAIEGDAISKAITGELIQGRQLGHNKTILVAANAIFAFTGNNITTTADFNSRVMVIYMNARQEDATDREFSRKDISRWAMDNRHKYFSAVLGIVHQYFRAGEPEKNLPSSRFGEMWDRFVRQPLVWYGFYSPPI